MNQITELTVSEVNEKLSKLEENKGTKMYTGEKNEQTILNS